MRVALFIDGKNFFAGWRDVTGSAEIDFRKLAPWLVGAAGGTTLLGAHYYTGVDDAIPKTPAQEKLDGFLDMIDQIPGFFVHRFEQKMRTQTCASCGHSHSFAREKEVDTTIVADMIRLAAVNCFDIAVLLSGDADLVAAVEGVRALGKKVLVASWGSSGLSARIRRAAFDHIDLAAGLAEFGRGGALTSADSPTGRLVLEARHAATGAPTFAHPTATPSNGGYAATPAPAAPLSNDPAVYEAAMIDELKRAQATMPGGYVGAHFFVTKWRSQTLPEFVDFRRRMLDRVVEKGQAEVYLTEDGIQAVRLKAVAR
ncbi:MAG: NYN domain-containing protein [Planctomycetes bacterium]|nr:NYN domain-containing protein [Planctomycetota bacterium]